MLEFEAQEQFASYLHESMSQSMLEDVKDVVRAAKSILALKIRGGSSDLKNVIFHQKQMLQVAEQFLKEKPWITYFASLKHFVWLRSKGIGPSSFDDFKDKEYTLSVEKQAEMLAETAEAKLAEVDRNDLQELLVLQQVEPLIPQCIGALKDVARAPLAQREKILSAPKKSFVGKLFSVPSTYEYVVKIDRALIAATAERLKQPPETWILSPTETIQYLSELQKRRSVLEQKYLCI